MFGARTTLGGLSSQMRRAAGRLESGEWLTAAGPGRPSVQASVRSTFFNATQSNFFGAHDPEGKPWAPLKWRKGAPLILTGNLFRTTMEDIMHTPVSATAAGLRFVVKLTTPYGKYHQRGTRTIPRRTFAGWNTHMVAEVEDAAAGALLSLFGEVP